MNWYFQSGKNSDVVLNSKITYVRNFRNFKFETKNIKDIEEIEKEIKSKLPSIGYNLKFFKLKDMDDLTRKCLLEKGLINAELAEDKDKLYSILINDEENICVMVNGQNHLEIQVFGSGMELENIFNFAKEIDEKFQLTFDIAKSKKYGYLTTSPIQVGTGIIATTTVHLPGLTKTGNIRKIMQTVNNFGLSFTGMYNNNSSIVGDIYQISNKQTLGISEDNIVKNVKAITDTVIEQERKARKILGKNQIEMEDAVYRSYGILANCRKISFSEALTILSNVKMGTDMGIIKEIDDKKVMEMYFYINSGNLQKYVGETLDGYDRDVKRAEMIKKIIEKK